MVYHLALPFGRTTIPTFAMKKPQQIPREPRRKLQNPDRNNSQDIRKLFEESEEGVCSGYVQNPVTVCNAIKNNTLQALI
jgi:hypothetical protein